jgi:hypothetical protein
MADSSANPTMGIELEGYKKNGPPGEERTRGGAMEHHKRARGGHMPEKKEKEEKHEKRAKGGHIPPQFRKHIEEEEEEHKKRKRGGHIDGKAPMRRPDKRARGGATSDENPETSAGKMSMLPYEKEGQEGSSSSRGAGPERD